MMVKPFLSGSPATSSGHYASLELVETLDSLARFAETVRDGALDQTGGDLTGDITTDSSITGTNGTFYSNSGLEVSYLRWPSRVFVGEASDFDGATLGNNAEANFLQDATIFDGTGTREWMLANTYLAVIARGGVPATFAGIADAANGRSNGYGSIHFVLNNTPISEAGDSRAYAQYIEGVRSAACDTTRGFELNAVNLGPSPKAADPQPGLLPARGGFPGMTVAAHIASGAGTGEFSTVYPSDAAVMIAPNASSFWTGISFLDGALEPWSDSRARAILLQRLERVSWFDGADNEVFAVDVTASGATKAQVLEFNNSGMSLLNDAGHAAFFVNNGADSSEPNYVAVTAVDGGAPIISAGGPDADIDLALSPKGTGAVNVTSGGVNVASGQYLIGGTQVVGAQQPAVSDVPTGASADVEANATAINAILAALRAHGLIAT